MSVCPRVCVSVCVVTTDDIVSVCVSVWSLQMTSCVSVCLCVVHTDDDVVLAQPDRDELQNVLRTLNSKLEDIRTCSDLIQKHGSSLQRAVVELELTESAADAGAKMKPVNERATLFRISSSAMINVRQCHLTAVVFVPAVLGLVASVLCRAIGCKERL